jgi:hypothetical protein
MKRFEDKVLKGEGCWRWSAAKLPTGYGIFRLNGRNHYAHRLAYELWVGEISKGMFVCHRCDNPSCVRPDHLFLGTNRDNIADRTAKGRSHRPIGERNPKAKLSSEDVAAIRSDTGRSSDIAKKYGIAPDTVRHIRNRRIWRHLQ